MKRFEATFDVIHYRLVETVTIDVHQFFYEAARALRPGGVLIAIAADAVSKNIL